MPCFGGVHVCCLYDELSLSERAANADAEKECSVLRNEKNEVMIECGESNKRKEEKKK